MTLLDSNLGFSHASPTFENRSSTEKLRKRAVSRMSLPLDPDTYIVPQALDFFDLLYVHSFNFLEFLQFMLKKVSSAAELPRIPLEVRTSISFLSPAIRFRQCAYLDDKVSSPGHMILFVPFQTLSVKVDL